jgi:uncharacterized protein YggE
LRVFGVSGWSAALLSLVMSMGLVVGSQALASDATVNTIVVTGESEVKAVADEVILTLSVATRDKELSKSLDENNARVKRIFDVLTSYGVEAKKIQTDYMRCSPEYETDRSRHRRLIGYRVSKRIVVTLNDLSKLEKLVSGAIEAGATHVDGIQFRTTQLRKHRDTARSLAMKHAKEKAEAMAAAIGQKIGRATSIKEGGWAPQVLPMYAQARQVVSAAYQGQSYLGESIAPGELTITAKVLVTFELQ